jgi:Predicted transcriptional regulators
MSASPRVVRRARKTTTPTPVVPAADIPAAPPAIATPLAFLIDIDDITPYQDNPRLNADAIESVANSIRSFGFNVPVVVDAGNVLVTGHTRIEAAKLLGMQQVPCIRAEHLSPEAIAQFRIVDNKVAEIADWNHEALAGELAKLAEFGIDWTQYGFNQEEVDCLADMVSADCLEVAELTANAAVEAAHAEQIRAPAQTRFVFGEVVFFVPQAAYRHWLDGIRALHDFDKDAIEAEIIQRLGIQPV